MKRRSTVLGVAAAAGLIAVETVAVVLLMELMPKERCESLYLLGVVAISMIWGRWLAVATSVFSALALAYVDDWPILHFSFGLENAVVVGVFLVVALLTNLVASAARARARETAVLAAQQAALRRVATLVARGARPPQVFAAVAEEMARCLEVDCVEVLRYEVDDSAVVVASYVASAEPHVALGERVALEGDNVAGTVLRTGRPARMDDYDSATGALAARLRKLGVRCRVGAPIVVDEHVWGTAVVGSSRAEPLAADTETQIADFTDLVATAIANAATRADLVASQARIVAAADDARRRLERDLHDGAQQRAVSLGLRLRMAEDLIPADLSALKEQLSLIGTGLTELCEEL
ncbi:MAG: hypothetical protein QOD02_2133, partial [Mycobacterium sp.]|nr:hypothetical protein [Mycobacterium sp.]